MAVMSATPSTTFTALAEPTRLHIVDMLAERGQLSASDISGAFETTPSAISQHLKTLRQAGLVTVERRAQQRIYRLDAAPMTQAQQWLQARLARWNHRLDALEALIEQERESSVENDLVITRIINAPVATVWRMWTDPAAIVRWWGPEDYTSGSATVDLREGGNYVFAMRAPDYQGGAESFTSGVYEEVVALRRLVFTQRLSDAEGNPLPADQLPPGFPSEVRTIVEFGELGGMTSLTITEQGWAPSPMRVFAYAGMHQSLDKMTTAVAG